MYDGELHNPPMETQTTKKKILRSYRLRPEIVDAIRQGMERHGYQEETAYIEAVLQLALGVKAPTPSRPSVSRKVLALAA